MRALLLTALFATLAAPVHAQRRNTPASSAEQAVVSDRALWRTMRDVRIECRAATQYLTWQWNRYAGPGAVPQGSPITAMGSSNGAQALNDLVAGVAHNQQAVGVYRSCAAAAGNDYLVWVAATASERSCDMSSVTTNLAWQKQNNLPSLNEAMRHWQAGRLVKTVAEENSHALAAVRELYAAVRHNGTASAAYRACFRDRPEDFFEAIRLMLDS